MAAIIPAMVVLAAMATAVTTTAIPLMDMETYTPSLGIAEISTTTIATTATTATTNAAMAEAATVAESGLPGGSSYYHHDD